MCNEVKICDYQKMSAIKDRSVLSMCQPHVFGRDADANLMYSNKDFPDRLMSLKYKHLKAVATEESLDDWHAQSLGIPYDKFVK